MGNATSSRDRVTGRDGASTGSGGVFAVRFHGRGGQGVVTAAELLALAAFEEGRHAQAFPTFGSERTGAPVAAFCRVGDAPIRTHSPVTHPDALVVLDPTLVHQVDLFSGVGPRGYVVVNSTAGLGTLGLENGDPAERPERPERRVSVAASRLAVELVGRPVPNAPLVGALAALCGVVSLASVESAMDRRFGGALGRANAAAARAAYQEVAGRMVPEHQDRAGAHPG